MKTEQTLPTEKITANSEQLFVLKNNFPQCFDKQGKFIVSKLQEVLQADGVDVSRESYSLNWLGKSYARVLANEPIRTMLSEDTEHNEQKQNKNSHNLLIQGDNLEVLKHLKGAYTDKIKMIYIDPPYNTGSDGFVYQDDRNFTSEQFAELAGVDLEEAKRVLDFTQSNANSHSAWLTFIYPRLYIAKQLLKDDGVIFISIDDNEQAQLKILCDEVFGEENFIASLIWKSRQNKDNRSITGVSVDHEYILAYSRTSGLRILRGAERNLDQYQNPDNDPRGDWTSANMVGLLSEEERPNCHYDLINPSTNINYGKPEMGWRYDKKSMKILIDKDKILWPKDSTGRPRRKMFLSELKDAFTGFSSIVGQEVFTRHGGIEIQSLFKQRIFDFPKPLKLLEELIEQISDTHSIVLDFFGGSGTTAHAILNKNAKDGGNRKFICVQIPESIAQNKEAYKVGYRTIFEITKDRIIKAGEKIVQESPESNFEHGFKIFKTCDNFLPSSNYRELKQLTLAQSDTSSITTGFDDAQLKDILTTWKGLDKILLSENLNTVSLGDYLAYSFGHVLYLVNKGFNTDALKDLIQKLDDEHEFQVSKLVILGHHFDSKSQREIDEAMKNYNNKKSIPVDVVVRY